jgi:hypothetical protein
MENITDKCKINILTAIMEDVQLGFDVLFWLAAE